MSAPIAWEGLEDALHTWLATDARLGTIYLVESESSGAPEPPPPCAQIRLLSGPIPLGQPEIRRVPTIMVQSVSVVTAGAGVLGVDFYLGFDSVPTAITITALLGQSLATLRTALLAQLVSDLPAGVTAAADPDSATGIFVTGSSGQPLFAMTATNSRTLVTPIWERFPEIECRWSRMTMRIEFRGAATRGFATAADLLAKAQSTRKRIGDPLLHAVGWRWAGLLAALPSIAADRNESKAVLDFAIEGYATALFQSPALRQVRLQLTAA
jgi:hypothetical protein